MTPCEQMQTQLQGVETILRQCCPTCNLKQCTQAVPGVCCPFSVSSNVNMTAMASFSKALSKFKTQCEASCPGGCAFEPSGMCSASTSLCQ
jgi:hypothetical protein